MPLQSSGLADALTAMFSEDGFPSSPTEAGDTWAQAYKDYAGGATAGPTSPLMPSLATAGLTLATALGGAFTAAKASGPASLAPTMAAAFAAFWLAPPIVFTATPPVIAGVVSVAVPGALPAGITDAIAAGVDGGDAAAQGQAFADALDTFTKTVMVLNTPITPPGPPSPSPLS